MANKFSGEIILSNFPALKHRNFRLFWFGQCISVIGTWMQNIGQSWLVLQITNSAFKLSLVSMLQFLPMLLFSLFAGTIVDRFPKRKILIFTQICLSLLAAILASITYFKVVQYWHLLVLALLLGAVNTLDVPARQSFFIELVGREDLMNAIALNSSIFNLARIIGPAVAGVLIGILGIAICFYLNALSFFAVIAGLFMINVPNIVTAKSDIVSPKHLFAAVYEGLQYIWENRIIKRPLILMAFMSIFIMNYNVLIPVFAQQNLSQNATGYGFLMTCMGIGSFSGALTIASRSKYGPNPKFLIGGALGMSIFMALLGLEKNYVLACATLFLLGLCSITFTALVNSTIQLNSAYEMRGRVISVYSLVSAGFTPIGSLYTGFVTESFGAPGCMIISGILGIIAASYTIFIFRHNN